MPNNKKRKLSPKEKAKRKIKTHTTRTAFVAIPTETWRRDANYVYGGGRGHGGGQQVTKMTAVNEASARAAWGTSTTLSVG